MPRFAANLTWLFSEYEFLDRFDAAAECGFEAVEVLMPYDHPAEAIAERLTRTGLTMALINTPSGNSAAGERGLAALAGRTAEFREDIASAAHYAEVTGSLRVHVLAGLAGTKDQRAAETYRDNMAFAADYFGPRGVEVMIEPINGRDIPDYFLQDFDFAVRLIEELARPNLKLQFDIYHRQILRGDVTMALRRLIPLIGHMQIASVPCRNEPDGEELNYPFLFEEIDRLGYEGFVGCEYRPRGGTREGLGWFARYRERTL
ncbi:MAG: hydroxypyruvate isomerase family protein [Methylobacteriaceae bacterium]|nr:hydroxypyruvate isomerase family protein [Methylobacteriaceae bacterium]